MVRNYQNGDEGALLKLWNTAGAAMGYAKLDMEDFERLLTGHPYFSPKHTFVLEENGEVAGFVNGCTGDDIPRGGERGYLSCLILSESADSEENTRLLLAALEASFKELGKRYSAVTFFNPIRLPWVIPGTDNHQHNNAPGVATELALHGRMLDFGYREAARESAMYLDLAGYETPEWVAEKTAKAASEGYTVDIYDAGKHKGLEAMLASLDNPLWSKEIPESVDAGMEVLVGLCGDTCAGFTGPIYPEKTGRGYFTGIGVAAEYERHGLGTLLFHRLCERERERGAKYMSLFTGEDNHARRIYLGAGFRIVRTFGVMIKDLDDQCDRSH